MTTKDEVVQEPVSLKPEDVIVETYPVESGGFSLKPKAGVRLIHKPTGVVVQCSSGRSQHSNRERAWRDLERYLYGAYPQTAAQPAPVQPAANASAWFALVMNAAAELEDASHCLRDEDAKRVAISGAKHYRDAANALYTTPAAQPALKPLTDEQIELALKAACMHSTPESRKDMRRAIEAAHGIKGKA